MNMTIKEIRLQNLIRLLKQSGLTKGAFATHVGTSPAYISQIFSKKSNRSIGDVLARMIESVFKKEIGWMDTLHADAEFQPKPGANQPITSNALILGGIEISNDDAPLAEDEVVAPFYKEMDIITPPGGTEVVEYHVQKMRFAKSTLKKAGVDPAHVYCLAVSGNSMVPVLPDGTVIAIDIGRTGVRDGDLYAIDHSGMIRVKLVYRHPKGGLRLRSYNQDEWPDELYTEAESRHIRILGRVFWWSILR